MYDETPWFEEGRHHEMSACRYRSGSDSSSAYPRTRIRGSPFASLSRGTERAVTRQPELSAIETAERGEQDVDSFRSMKRPTKRYRG